MKGLSSPMQWHCSFRTPWNEDTSMNRTHLAVPNTLFAYPWNQDTSHFFSPKYTRFICCILFWHSKTFIFDLTRVDDLFSIFMTALAYYHIHDMGSVHCFLSHCPWEQHSMNSVGGAAWLHEIPPLHGNVSITSLLLSQPPRDLFGETACMLCG